MTEEHKQMEDREPSMIEYAIVIIMIILATIAQLLGLKSSKGDSNEL